MLINFWLLLLIRHGCLLGREVTGISVLTKTENVHLHSQYTGWRTQNNSNNSLHCQNIILFSTSTSSMNTSLKVVLIRKRVPTNKTALKRGHLLTKQWSKEGTYWKGGFITVSHFEWSCFIPTCVHRYMYSAISRKVVTLTVLGVQKSLRIKQH